MRVNGYWIVSPPNKITPYGTDTVSYTNGVATVKGVRGFMCMIKYVCRDQTATRNARYWLEQARMSLYRPVVQEHFREYDMALTRMAPTMSFDAPYVGRMESIAASEMSLTCAVVDTLGAENVGTIDRAEVGSDFDAPNAGANFIDTIGPVI